MTFYEAAEKGGVTLKEGEQVYLEKYIRNLKWLQGVEGKITNQKQK